MFGMKKSCPTKDIKTMLKEHIELVELALFKTMETLERYLNDNIEDAKKYARAVDAIEPMLIICEKK